MKQRATGWAKCCAWSRRDKLLAKGLHVVEAEMDVARVLKRQRLHNAALKAMLNPNQRQLCGLQRRWVLVDALGEAAAQGKEAGK